MAHAEVPSFHNPHVPDWAESRAQSTRAHQELIESAQSIRGDRLSALPLASIKPINDPELEMQVANELVVLDIVPFRLDRAVDRVFGYVTDYVASVLRYGVDQAGEAWRQADRRTGRILSRAVLPVGKATLVLVAAACGQQAISSPPEIPTSAPIARPTETPTSSSTAIAEAQKPTPIPTPTEVSPLDAIFDYTVCTGKFSDPETGRTGSILITFIPASGMKQGGTSAIAFFVSSRNERNQIDEQQYVIPIKATGNNNFDGNRGFWDAKNIIIDPINKQVTGIIEGPPGNYNFQRLQCGGNGKAAFTAALTSMRSSIDPTKVFDALEKFGVNWSKWPN